MKLDSAITRNLWIAWLAAVAVTAVVYSRTLTITPTIWQDEVMLLDWGRLVNKTADKSYSINWLPALSRPMMSINFLGNGIQEFFYNLFGPGPTGPRISSIIGALLGSFFMLGWLLRRGCVGWIALACALAFLWDPLFVEGYRGARVDSWAMACVLASCWLLATTKHSSGHRLKILLLAAGACVALAGFFWVSAVILLPLVAYEFISNEANKRGNEPRAFLRAIIWFAAGGVCAALLLLLFMPEKLGVVLHDLRADSLARIRWNIHDLFGPFVRSPFVPVLAVLALFLGRKWGLAAATFAAALGVLSSGAYVHRDVYLLPYFFLAIAAVASVVWQEANLKVAKMAIAGAFCAMLAWSGSLSLGVRTVFAENQREARDPDRLLRLMREAVGEGPITVYLGSYELYYAGRELGWRFFKGWGGENWDDPNLLALVDKVEFLIHRKEQARPPSPEFMSSLGFLRKEVSTGAQPPRQVTSRPQANTFTDYVIYQRQKAGPTPLR